MKAGQYHYARVEPTHVTELAGLAGYVTYLISSNRFMHFDLSLNTQRAATLFSDPRVRRALFHGIDREAIANQLMEGTVQVANTPINPTSPYHNADVAAPEYDPEVAARMLNEAGWVEGPEGVRVKDGQAFSFTVLNRAGTADRIAIAQVIQAQLKQIGVDVTFETLEAAAWAQAWRSFDWETVVSAWLLPADPSFTGLYKCDGPNNMTGLCDADLDEIMEASDRALDFAEPQAAPGRGTASARSGRSHATHLLRCRPRARERPGRELPWERDQLRELLEPVGVEAQGLMSPFFEASYASRAKP